MDNNKEKEVLQVSDWSQKYKLAIYAVSGFIISAGLWKVIGLLEQIATNTAK